MSLPVDDPYVTCEYGVPGSHWAAGYHTGRDYRAAVGDPVYATRSGVVIHAGTGGWGSAYGKQVIVDHDSGIQSLYAHLSSVVVSEGGHVGGGELLGLSGATGNVTAAHLHYEERRAPYGYWEHRRPEYDLEDDVALSDDDIEKIAERVWAYAFNNADDNLWPAKNFLYWIHANVNKILDRV